MGGSRGKYVGTQKRAGVRSRADINSSRSPLDSSDPSHLTKQIIQRLSKCRVRKHAVALNHLAIVFEGRVPA